MKYSNEVKIAITKQKTYQMELKNIDQPSTQLAGNPKYYQASQPKKKHQSVI